MVCFLMERQGASMPRTFAWRVNRLVRDCSYYGKLARKNELRFRLVPYAVRPEFFELIDALPGDIVSFLKEFAADSPAHPEDVVIGYTGAFNMTPDEWDAFEAQDRLKYYWGCRRLREYFYPELQIPEFQLEKCIGNVQAVCDADGDTVLLGDLQDCYIRSNPVEIRQNGESFPIRTGGRTCVKRESDQQSEDPIIRSHGRAGLIVRFLQAAPDEVAIGAELWVDRTAVRDIPELLVDDDCS